MTEMHLSLTRSPTQIFKVANHLATRHRDASGRGWLWIPALCLGPLAACLLAAALGMNLNHAFVSALVSLLAVGTGEILYNRMFNRHYLGAFSASAYHARPSRARLSPHGLRMEAREFTWADITGVTRWNDMTLLHFSPVDALTVLDSDLPPGMTPETFAARITEWKAG